jgi:hypothetical protein
MEPRLDGDGVLDVVAEGSRTARNLRLMRILFSVVEFFKHNITLG